LSSKSRETPWSLIDADVVIVMVVLSSTPVEVGLRYQLPILGLPCPDYAIRRAVVGRIKW
jgi:hypothetical protein